MKQSPDAFIHYNAFKDSNVGGFNIYYSQETDLRLAEAIHRSLASSIELRDRGVLIIIIIF